MNEFPQKPVALVTGASSGLGAAIAHQLLIAGWKVFGTSRYDQTPGSIEWLKMDLRSPGSIEAAAEELFRATDRIDAVINNAGVALGGPAETATQDEIAWQMDTNFNGVVQLTQLLLPKMREQGKGRIFFVSSIGGRLGLPFQSFYSASKFALEGFAEALSIELKPFGIWVSLFEPGDFRTAITDMRKKPAVIPAAYGPAYRSALAIIEKYERQGSDPRKMAELVVKAIESKKPKLRYQAGKLDQVASIWLKSVLPGRVMEQLMADYYKCWKPALSAE